MTQEEKELVKEDICERLHYGISVLVHDTFPGSVMPYENVFLKVTNVSDLIDNISLNERYYGKDLFNKIIKQHKEYLEFYPYLRPMSNMTEEEKEHLQLLHDIISDENYEDGYTPAAWDAISEFNDYCHERHIDNRGLIGKGLALEAPEGMYGI